MDTEETVVDTEWAPTRRSGPARWGERQLSL
jgi:hypothetical protein